MEHGTSHSLCLHCGAHSALEVLCLRLYSGLLHAGPGRPHWATQPLFYFLYAQRHCVPLLEQLPLEHHWALTDLELPAVSQWCLLIDRGECRILPEDSGESSAWSWYCFSDFHKKKLDMCCSPKRKPYFLVCSLYCAGFAARRSLLWATLVELGPGDCCNLPPPFLTSRSYWKVAAPGTPGFLTWLTNATNLEHMFFRVHLKPGVPNLQAQHLPVKTASFFLNSLFASPWTIGFYNSNKEMRLWV